MEVWLQMVITIVCSILGSSGIWAYLSAKADKKDAKSKMLLGLGHDRIMYLGCMYIAKGYITKDEYENLHDYLYKPYEALGGNGSAKKIMAEVDKLPIKN